ncbi:hypothetical protein [Streptomyces sp. SID1034]|uniref:hypothetical protein n=1 Tax=Streptomyces sp. SID1034 TaxID=2690248 RepID=UPI00136CE982|nr:hypothetical protein [Streptomyces sp. SID1034]MYV94244.1 hypothetical protein [Streptomyces sp. SID1034]
MTSAERPSVSPRTERALRDAMERLFAGRPARTDGKLTKNNLWREAGVSRATMNRATNVLVDWDNRIGRSPARAQDRKQAETITALRQHLRKARTDRDRLQDQVDAAATVIAALYAENAALREQISSQSAIVVPLTPRR